MKTITLRIDEETEECINQIWPYLKEKNKGAKISKSDMIRICIADYWVRLKSKGYI